MRKLLSPLKDAVKPIRGHSLFERARSAVARPVRYPPLSPTLRAHMEEYYARDVDCLSTLIGRDLRHWPASARKAASQTGRQGGEMHVCSIINSYRADGGEG